MNHAQLTLHVRQVVHQALHRHGAPSDVDPNESILIQDGYYFGRRFTCDSLQAIWLLEDNQIRLTDDEGSLLEEFLVDQSPNDETQVA